MSSAAWNVLLFIQFFLKTLQMRLSARCCCIFLMCPELYHHILVVPRNFRASGCVFICMNGYFKSFENKYTCNFFSDISIDISAITSSMIGVCFSHYAFNWIGWLHPDFKMALVFVGNFSWFVRWNLPKSFPWIIVLNNFLNNFPWIKVLARPFYWF